VKAWAAGLVLIAVAVVHVTVLEPLEQRRGELVAELARLPRVQQPAQTREKIDTFYRRVSRPETSTDWLAKLHAIGMATGVQLQSASYRTQKTDAKIVRYEIALPVAGSYGQIRDFLKRSLAEIPILSVDQLTLKREGKNNVVTAEMRLTLHMVKS